MYPSNRIPNKNGSYIVNVDKAGQPGSHWIAVIKDNDKLYIWDSFARPTTQLVPHLKRNFSPNIQIIDAEYDPEQVSSEENCGARSLAVLLTAEQIGIDAALLI